MNFLNFSRRFVPTLTFQKVQQVRTLFTDETLGLVTYQNNRQDALNNVDGANRFKWELQAYMENESNKDANKLKNALEILVHLVQPDSDDVSLVKKSLYAFDTTDGVKDKAKRSIGNLAMQYAHSSNMPDVAVDFYDDSNLQTFFGGFKCTLLLMNLLYINKKFEKIIEIDLKNRQQIWSSRTNFSKFIDVLVFGACYKMNTAESFDYAQKLWSTVGETAQFKRSVSFVAASALNQEKPSVVIEMLEPLERSFVNEQIKILALADLGNIDKISEALSTWDNHEKLSKLKISKNVLDRIHERLKNRPSTDAQEKFQDIYNKLIADNRFSNETLDEILDRNVNSRIGVRGKRATPVADLQ